MESCEEKIFEHLNSINKIRKQQLASDDYCAKKNQALDTTYRYQEFWLAVHYFECQFLLGKFKWTDLQKNTLWKNVVENMYYRLACLTPCMVMTFYMLPKNFMVKVMKHDNVKTSYLYNFIDLLIVDEAGQTSPEIAAPSFSLAKKAIVVGDEKQIPPVWNITPNLDSTLAKNNHVILTSKRFAKILDSGHNCSSSSVMHIAKNTCAYTYLEAKRSTNNGLLLKEHWRCYDEIIQYCNELVYEGNLIPCRGNGSDDKKYLLPYPHMGYYKVLFKKSTICGTSRYSEDEAYNIALWLKNNFPAIKRAYPDPQYKPDEILAIITPFKAQVSKLKTAIKRFLPHDAKNINVGTVHTFQGAEKRVIIFSTVYGSSENCHFIKSNANLMNVAVSRAKDAFWVFGSYDCLKQSESDTCKLLIKHLKPMPLLENISTLESKTNSSPNSSSTEKSLSTPDTTSSSLDILSQEYSLSPVERAAIEKFITLNPSDRATIMNFLMTLGMTIHSHASDIPSNEA